MAQSWPWGSQIAVKKNTHVCDLSTHDILKLFLTSTEKNFLCFRLRNCIILWYCEFLTKWEIFALWKLKIWSYFPNHDILIPTLHLCQKYTIKRYCLKELKNYISCIIYMFIIFSGLSTSAFSTFYFGKLVFCLLVFIICFLFFMSFKFNIIKTFMYVVYICAIWPLVILFSLDKNYFLFVKIQFSHMLVNTCFQRGFEKTKNHL